VGFVRNKIDNWYRLARGVPTGLDPALSAADLAAFIAGKVVARVRGIVRGFPRVFLGRHVRIATRSRVKFGRNVAIADFVWIDALSRTGIVLGDSVTVDRGAVLRGSGVIRDLGVGIRVGDRTAIGLNNLVLGQGGVSIGADCLLGPNVTVVSENHNYADPAQPIRSQGETRLPTVIEDDVWVGANAVILGGAYVGRGAVIAAGAVVRGRVPANAVVAGVPARQVGHRG
jgi:acetyltransferase-like isoleucine patch superfamily enzyme